MLAFASMMPPKDIVPVTYAVSSSNTTFTLERLSTLSIKKLRKSSLRIDAVMLEKFKELNINDVIIQALNEMGFEEPTPIQAESIPVALSGNDMIGQAQTGTGKTAAYAIPVLEKILAATPTKDIQTVVLSPTRELAMQVAEEINHLAQFTNIQALPIYGGQDIDRQLRRLRKNPQIVVATPGRLIDHMHLRSNQVRIIFFILSQKPSFFSGSPTHFSPQEAANSFKI